MVRELAQSYVGVDPVHEPIPVRPVCTTRWAASTPTSTAATPLRRTVRRRRMRLRVDQRRQPARLQLAGRDPGVRRAAPAAAAAAFALEAAPAGAYRAASHGAEARAGAHPRRCSRARAAAKRVAGLRKAMNDTMESGAGIYRSRALAAGTCRKLAELRARYATVQLQDRSNVFNTDLLQVLELGSMLEVAEALAHSALRRKESRGSHQRLDHPGRDDDNYLKHSLASYRGAEPPAIELSRRGDHALAAGGARLWREPPHERDRHARGPALPAGDRQRAAFPDLHRALQRGLGGARRAQSHQGPSDATLVLPLVLPHGGVRQLRHDDQRRAEARRATPSCATTAARRSGSSRSIISRSSATW